MPDAEHILAGLADIAGEWRLLAGAWHVWFGAWLLLLALGKRTPRRVAGMLLAAPLVSVAVLAWAAGNPFNGTAFTVAIVLLFSIAAGMRSGPFELAPLPWILAGSVMVLFGWFYPHFLTGASPAAYALAGPLGLIPCPTLSMLTGLSLILGGLGSFAWSFVLGTLGIFYGAFGASWLGVRIDWILAAGAAALLVQAMLRVTGAEKRARGSGEPGTSSTGPRRKGGGVA